MFTRSTLTRALALSCVALTSCAKFSQKTSDTANDQAPQPAPAVVLKKGTPEDLAAAKFAGAIVLEIGSTTSTTWDNATARTRLHICIPNGAPLENQKIHVDLDELKTVFTRSFLDVDDSSKTKEVVQLKSFDLEYSVSTAEMSASSSYGSWLVNADVKASNEKWIATDSSGATREINGALTSYEPTFSMKADKGSMFSVTTSTSSFPETGAKDYISLGLQRIRFSPDTDGVEYTKCEGQEELTVLEQLTPESQTDATDAQ